MKFKNQNVNLKKDYVLLVEEERNLDTKTDEEEVYIDECDLPKDCTRCHNVNCNAYWQINDNKYIEEMKLREYYSKKG